MTEQEKIELAKKFVAGYYPPSKELTGAEINVLLDFIGWQVSRSVKSETPYENY